MFRYGEPHRKPGSPYWYVFRIDDDAPREHRYKLISTKRKTKREAYEWIRLHEQAPAQVEPVTFAEAADKYLSVKTYRPSTRQDYGYAFGILKGKFEKELVHRISPADLEEWLTSQKDWSSRTRNKYITTLRTFFKWCVKRGCAAGNPALAIDKVRENKYKHRVLTEAEEERLLGACRTPFKVKCKGFRQGSPNKCEWEQEYTPPKYLYEIVLVALRTGLRFTNIVNLRWDQVDWENRILRMKASEMKSKRDWSLPIEDKLYAVLLSLFEENREKPRPSFQVFDHMDCVRKGFNAALVRAKLPKIRFHDLRGTFLTRIAPHTDPKTLQQIADHASIQTTLGYYVGTDQKRVAKALKEAFEG